jgi:hypothetical protein
MLRLFMSVMTLMAVSLFSAPSAHADPVCTAYDLQGVCILWVAGPGGGGGGGPGRGSPGGGGAVQPISINGTTCWPGGRSNPQPDKSEPVWAGHTDGAIYDCVVPPAIGRGGLLMAGWTIKYWSAAAPAPPPNPVTLAQEAIATMNLKAITVGIVPDPSGVGLVGMPNWMWVTNPTVNTWGPLTRSASAAGWTVTATAQVSKVTWNMGDGQVVVCNGPGTRYQDSYGKQQSPDCGHTYTRQGAYTVRATSHWVITWAGIGQTGTIPMDLTNTAALTIGEAQVLRQ